MKRRDALRKALDRHQLAAVNWAYRRIAKAAGVEVPERDGSSERYKQIGVVLADGVGRGKTWEAMVACARLLEAQARRTKSGAKRDYRKQAPSHVLVLTPPGLVHKWAYDELRHADFVGALTAWKAGGRGRNHAFKTLTHVIDVANKRHMQVGGKATVRKKFGRHRLDGGTYVVNVNIIAKGPKTFGTKASPGRRLFDTDWNVVIVDEAHHKVARNALAKLSKFSHVMLLTATPFQMSPGDLRQPLTWVLNRGSPKDNPGRRLLSNPPVRTFMESVNAATGVGGLKITDRMNAERVLRQLISRSRPPRSRRQYSVIGNEGRLTPIPDPWLWRDADTARALAGAVEPSATFRTTYVRERIRLLGSTSDFVPNALRQLLSTFEQYTRGQKARGLTLNELGPHPKVEAVAAWFEKQFRKDLKTWTEKGIPRKTIVFLRFVGDRSAGTRQTLLKRLGEIATKILSESATAAACVRAKAAIEQLQKALLPSKALDGRAAKPLKKVVEEVRKLGQRLKAKDPLVTLLASPPYVARLAKWLRSKRVDYEKESALFSDGRNGSPLESTAQKRRRETLKRLITRTFHKDLVEAFTGIERDHTGISGRFRSPWLPWVLLASQVAEEGIDLQTYTKHIVHYEVEWNPARMEQREGRGDRRGRLLKEPIDVYFPLVGQTYEERMLHQLVTRMKWHGVLLGKGAVKLGRDEGKSEYRSVDDKDLSSMQLDLSPRRR